MTATRHSHTDLSTGGWVRLFPPAMRPFLLLARLDRPVGVWLLFLPGAWGITLARPTFDGQSLRLLLLFAFGSLVMRAAGCVVNDIWDRDIDAQVSRTAMRPLASGQISVFSALIFLACLLGAGLLVLMQLPAICWMLAPVALILVALYPAAKRVTWWPQLVMGFTFGFGAPMGYAAASGTVDLTALLLYLGTIFWQLGFDTIYGFQDIEDDARIGVKSTSRLWQNHARAFVGTSYTIASIFFGLSALEGGLTWTFWPIALVASTLLIWQVSTLHPDKPPACLKLFKMNIPYGIVLAIALIISRLK